MDVNLVITEVQRIFGSPAELVRGEYAPKRDEYTLLKTHTALGYTVDQPHCLTKEFVLAKNIVKTLFNTSFRRVKPFFSEKLIFWFLYKVGWGSRRRKMFWGWVVLKKNNSMMRQPWISDEIFRFWVQNPMCDFLVLFSILFFRTFLIFYPS